MNVIQELADSHVQYMVEKMLAENGGDAHPNLRTLLSNDIQKGRFLCSPTPQFMTCFAESCN